MKHPFRKLLVSTDFSPLGNAAVATAFPLALVQGAELVLAHVLEELDMPNPLYAHYRTTPSPEEVQKLRGHAVRELTALVPSGFEAVSYEVMLGQGRPAEELCRMAEECGATMIVIASHGRTGVERFLLGSVAERVVRHAPCSVLLLKG